MEKQNMNKNQNLEKILHEEEGMIDRALVTYKTAREDGTIFKYMGYLGLASSIGVYYHRSIYECPPMNPLLSLSMGLFTLNSLGAIAFSKLLHNEAFAQEKRSREEKI